MQTDLWTYTDTTMDPMDIEGFKVVATDGEIGAVDEATYDVGSSYIVVDTGPWIFGRKVLLPAGVIQTMDLDNKKVHVRVTKDQVKDSPEIDDSESYSSEAYRTRVGTYYAGV
jgi:hypothetical protein